MGRLKALQPRVQPVTSSIQTINPDSWRTGKTSSQRGYDYKWQKARAAYLKANPLCVYCQREDRVTVATVVDHIEAHQGDQAMFWSKANWQPLCKPCHDSTKAREEGRAGP